VAFSPSDSCMCRVQGIIGTPNWSNMGLIFRNFGSLDPDMYPVGQVGGWLSGWPQLWLSAAQCSVQQA
jgi:hypothetical protein